MELEVAKTKGPELPEMVSEAKQIVNDLLSLPENRKLWSICCPQDLTSERHEDGNSWFDPAS